MGVHLQHDLWGTEGIRKCRLTAVRIWRELREIILGHLEGPTLWELGDCFRHGHLDVSSPKIKHCSKLKFHLLSTPSLYLSPARETEIAVLIIEPFFLP